MTSALSFLEIPSKEDEMATIPVMPQKGILAL